MRRVAASAVLVLAALAAGCGSSGGSDIEQAQDAVRDYVGGIAEGDSARSCARMSGAAQEEFIDEIADEAPGGGIASCEAAVERLSGTLTEEELAPLRDPQIDVTLNRDKATAKIAGGPSDITVIKVGGDWLVDAG